MAKQNIDFRINEDQMKLLISRLNYRLDKIYLGGGKSKIE